MAENSIAAELMQQINLTKLRPTPNYLSVSDAITAEEFELTEYGTEYSLDMSNINWGNASNDSHVFDIFCEFSAYQDSSKTRLDMLNFVAANNQCYKWDCHVFFSMYEISLDTWLKKMAYWRTKADELAIYALSDMFNVHSFVVTKHCPWTTIDSSVQGTALEILHLCPVKYVFLGDNRYGRLWRKIVPTQPVSTHQTELLPVFPDAQPILQEPAPPSLIELETAEMLLTIQDAQPSVNTILELQELTVSTVNQTSELILESPPITTDNQDQVDLHDAMDKVTNHEDVSFTEPNNWLKFCDCMDLVTWRVSELVESVNLSNLAILDQIKTPPCRVGLVWIKFTLTVKLPTLQTTQDLLALGDYFTRSKTKPKKHRRGRRLRSASTDIDYKEITPSSDTDKKQKPKRTRITLPADSPTASQVQAQMTSTGIPSVRLPPVYDSPQLK